MKQANKMPLSKGKLALIAGVCIGISIGLIAYLLQSEGPSNTGVSSTTATVGSSRDFGTYWDWQLATNPLASRLRDEISVPLLELRRGRPTPRLIKEYTYSPESKIAAIHLREQVFWSDGILFNADQVRAAFERLTRVVAKGYVISPVYAEAFKGDIKLTVIDSHTIEFSGVKDQASLELLLSYHGLRPIRPDLLAGDPNQLATGPEGEWLDPYLVGEDRAQWQVGIGPYSLQELKTGALAPDTELNLMPNPGFYRGLRRKGLVVKIADVVASNPAQEKSPTN